MNFKKFGIIILLVFSFIPLHIILAQTTGASTTGFVPGNIWYSQDPFVEGDKIKIYTVIFNGDTRELSGTVSFFDDLTLLGKKNFSLTGKSVKDVNIDWTVTAGDHKIYATIINSKYLVGDGEYKNVILEENETDKSNTTVKKKITSTGAEELDGDEKKTILGTEGGQIDRIAESIKENTPDIVSKPIIASVTAVESIRQSLETSTGEKSAKLKAEIEVLEEEGKVTADPERSDAKVATKSNLERPFKNAELFFIKVFYFIFKNTVVFYMLLAAILLYMVRYIITVFR